MRRIRLKNRSIKRKKNQGVSEWFVFLVIFFFIVMGVEFYEFIDRGSPLRSLGIKCSRVNPEDVQKMVGLNPGTNLFKAKLKELTLKLTKDSRIKSVHIFRNLSEGKIEIEINERVPFIKVLKSGAGKCLEVDEDGVIIGEADNIAGNVPLITGLSIDYSSCGTEGINTDILVKAIEILKGSVSSGIPMEEISEVNLKDPSDVILFTTQGIEFHLGNEELSQRLKRASTILSETRKKGISVKYVDLRFGEEAITKM